MSDDTPPPLTGSTGNPADSLLGIWILGQFRIIKALAAGGMSQVYLAEQASMDRFAAIKIVRTSDSQRLDWQRRFRHEARAASRLNHPNIVTIYNFGELADGTLFLAMEYIDGLCLGDFLHKGPLSLGTAIAILQQCTAALAYAHQMGVIHRDFKPENVMLTDVDGRAHVKVLDFGLARLTGDGSDTEPGVVLGTPRYMSPEQCRGEPALVCSDQYSLGLVFYELLTGRAAFQADTTIGYLHLHQNTLPPLPSRVNPVPGMELLDPVVARMIAKQPKDRFADMAEVSRALETLRASLPPSSISSPAPLGSTPKVGALSGEITVTLDTKKALLPDLKKSRPRALTAIQIGSQEVLSAEGWKSLEDSGLVLQRWNEGAAELADTVSAYLYFLGASEGSWRESSQEWIQKGVPLEKTLLCIDAPYQTTAIEGLIDHFSDVLIGSHPINPTLFSAVLRWMSRNGEGGIECLLPDRGIQVLQITSSTQKSSYVDALLKDARDSGIRQRALQSLAELGEEMILNAIFHAPVNYDGTPRYTHLPRDSEVVLRRGEEATLRWLIHERFVVVSIHAPFGSLPAGEVFHRITGGPGRPSLDPYRRGMGMGLHIISRAAQHLVFAICPGTWCEILAIVPRDPMEASGSKRSLCVLQSIGQTSRRIGDRLRMREIKHQGSIRIELKGEINETSILRSLFNHTGPIHLDLQGVSRINSVGLRAWIDAFRERPPGVEIIFERCSPVLVNQIDILPLLTDDVRITSVMAPYCCTSCKRESLELVFIEEMDGCHPPSRQCVKCAGHLQFDGMPEEYFAFLR
jgi:serine/threonine protein kinase